MSNGDFQQHLAGLWLDATACDSRRLLPDSGITWKTVALRAYFLENRVAKGGVLIGHRESTTTNPSRSIRANNAATYRCSITIEDPNQIALSGMFRDAHAQAALEHGSRR